MIRLPELPLECVDALAFVHSLLEDVSQVSDKVFLVGGCLRNLVLGGPEETKDYDVILLGLNHKITDFSNLSGAELFKEDPQAPKAELEQQDDGASAAPESVRILLRDRQVDLIFPNDGAQTIFGLLNIFDIGICKIAHNGLHWVVHSEFVEDALNKEIRVRAKGAHGEDNVRRRLGKLQTYYPDFVVNDDILKELFA